MKASAGLPALTTVFRKPRSLFSLAVVRQLSGLQRLLYGIAAALLVLLGLLGLVLPVLPGLVFLALAAGLLARLSPRFGSWWYRKPLVQRFHQKQQELKTAWPRIWRRYCRGILAAMTVAMRWLVLSIGSFGMWVGALIASRIRRGVRRRFTRG